MAAYPEETAHWDVVFDDRGHFTEPHTGYMIGLGTLKVREYVASAHELRIDKSGCPQRTLCTRGPRGAYGALLYIEKEGFTPILEQVQLDKRFDIGIMSSKGMSGWVRPRASSPMKLSTLSDSAGVARLRQVRLGILGTFTDETRRYTFENAIKVVDLGIRLGDVQRPPNRGCLDEAARTSGGPIWRRTVPNRPNQILLQHRSN